MFYFKIKRDSELYSNLMEAEAMKKKWFTSKDELFTAIGLEPTEDIYMSPSQYYSSTEPPTMVRNCFGINKQNGAYVAKKGSKINKAWVAKCKELGLEFVDGSGRLINDAMLNVSGSFERLIKGNRIHTGLKTGLLYGGDYYLEGSEDLSWWSELFEQIPETEYLQARLEAAEKAS